MPYRELNFDRHNISFAMSEFKDLFRMHYERGCRYVTKHGCPTPLGWDHSLSKPTASSAPPGLCSP